MKQSELREIVKQTILENQPQRAPQRQSPDREVIEKPDTAPSKPTRRRTLTPPHHAPTTAPKAESVIKENEQEVANKIASRFKKLGGGINEIRVDTFKPVPQEKVDIFAEKKKQELIASGKTEEEAEAYKQKILQSYENQLGLYNIKMSRFKK